MKGFVWFSLLLIALLRPNLIQADEPKTDKAAIQTESKSLKIGQTAHIDPSTGELTSTPTNSNTNPPSASVTQSSLPAVEIKTLANGTVQASLNGRFRTPLVAQIGCDGQIIMKHAEGGNLKAIECGDSE